MRDQVGAASARDFKRVLRALFGITVDVAEARRTIRVHEDDWPLLAWHGSQVFLNIVGTFSVASAGCWWDRLAAALGRMAHYALSALADVWLPIVADDSKMEAGGPRVRSAIMSYRGS